MYDQPNEQNIGPPIGSNSIDPIRAWDTVKDQLRSEMDKATFSAWVADAWLISGDDDLFTIGVKNSYTRDWIESRLTSTITRVLIGVMGRNVAVKFVVAAPDAELPQSQNRAAPGDADEGPAEIDEELKISIERGLYEAFTKPDSALYFPGYWLRWVPYMGAGPFLTVLAFRQALYKYMRDNEEDSPFKSNFYFSVSETRVANIIGKDRKTISRQRDGYVNKKGVYIPPKLTPFIEVNKTQPNDVVIINNKIKKNPHKYAFKQSPITPQDLEAILNYLLDQGLEKDPVQALEKAIEAQPKEIISFPMPAPTRLQKKAVPADLTAEILKLCQPDQRSDEQRRKIIELAELLGQRIMQSAGLVKIPLYFLKYLTKYLENVPAVLVIWLRAHAFFNASTGEIRDHITMENGLARMAAFLGISKAGVYNHLPCELATKKQKRIGEYISEVRAPGDGTLSLKINLRDQLIPPHRKEYELALKIASYFIGTRPSPETIEYIFSKITQKKPVDSGHVSLADSGYGTIQDSRSVPIDDSGGDHPDSGAVPLGDSGHVTSLDSGGDTVAALERFRECLNLKYLSFKYLDPEILKSIILKLMTSLNTPTVTPTGNKITWIQQWGGGWDFEKILSACKVDSKTKLLVRENKVTPEAFISHLLYAFSPEGKTIKHPVRYVISKITQEGDGDLGHNSRHDRLASLGALGIQELIQKSRKDYGAGGLTISPDLKGAGDWQRVMGADTSLEKLYELGEVLGLLKINV